MTGVRIPGRKARDAVNITILGATGGTGTQAVRQALKAGHRVTAVVRDPSRLDVPQQEALDVVTADVTEPRRLRPLLEGRDAVLSGLGPKSRRQTGIASASTRALMEAAAGTGTRRLIAISAMPVGGPIEGDPLLLRRVLRPMLHALLRDAYADLAAMEALLAASDLEWTVLRAPRLTDGPRTRRLRTKVGGSLPGAGTISRADLAHAMLEAVTDHATFRQVVGVASAR